MKKSTIVIIGLILTALVFASCGPKGGTIEVTNGFSVSALISVGKVLPSLDDLEAVKKGEMKKFSFDEDGVYTVGGKAADLSTGIKTKTVTLSGGETVKVTIGP